jgi:hypothetical protein
MKSLKISKNKDMTPPQVVPSLIDATLAWAHKCEGQTEQFWSFIDSSGHSEAGADFFFDRSTEFAKVMAVSRRLGQS